LRSRRPSRSDSISDQSSHGRRLTAHTKHVDSHGTLTIEEGTLLRIGEAIDDPRNLPEAHLASVGATEEENVGEFAPEVTALGCPEEHLAPPCLDTSTREIHRTFGNPAGHVLQRQVIGPQVGLGHLDTDLERANTGKLDLCDVGMLEQLIPRPLGDIAERVLLQVSVENEGDHLLPARQQANKRALGILGERCNPIDRVLDVLQRLVRVCPEQELDQDNALTFERIRRDTFDTVETTDSFLDRKHDPLLNLRRTRPRVRHLHLHDVEVYLGKHLLFDVERSEKPPPDQHEHQQIGYDAVPRHPGERPPGLSAVTHG
jgi:hypothetical protein